MTPTEEQQAIIEAAKTTSDNLLVNALAGTAKTSSIEMLCKAVTGIPILSLQFNKRTADEAKKRMPSHVEARTMNSLGHGVWAGVVGKRLTVDTGKMYTILKGVIDEQTKGAQSELRKDMAEILRWLRYAKRDGYVPPKWAGLGKPVFSDFDEWAGHHDDEGPAEHIHDVVLTCLDRSIEGAYKGQVDFDDQVYMPVIFGGTWPKFPLVCVDEAQDLSPLNHLMIERLYHKRLIAVGDPWQCHPPGTLITVTGGGQVPIEGLQVGQEVVSYFTGKSVFKGMRRHGRKIETLHTEHFTGKILTITAGDKQMQVTPNHKCLVRYDDTRRYCLYLMRKNNQYRIGICRLAYKEGAGIPTRARQEKADAAWLLAVYENKETAKIYEKAFSGMFGVPQLLFQDPFNRNQQAFDKAWNLIGDNTHRAEEALDWFGRDIKYPLWNGDGSHVFTSKSFITEACNVIDGMRMCVLPNFYSIGADKSREWRTVSVEQKPYNGPVYGITVEPTERDMRLYLANEIVTHNSIYAFRGAVSNGMQELQRRWAMRELTLSVTFRVPKRGVERAWSRVPHYKWWPANPDGHIETLEEWNAETIPDGAAIICRNNAPLFSCALKLLKAGRSIKLVGMDIGAGLVRVLKKLGPPTLTNIQMNAALDDWMRKELRRAKREETVYEKAECLRVLMEGHHDLNSAILGAEALFKREGPIHLMSGHKAKGLEFDVVFHLDSWRIPSKFAKPGTEQMEQELNIRYVIDTRFKKELYLINMEDYG